MTEENKAEEPELKIKEEADGSVTVGEPKVEDSGEDSGDERLSESGSDDHDETNPEDSDEEAEARRLRNRDRRAKNKESRKEYIDSLKRELSARDRIINDLSTRMQTVERKSSGSEMAQLERAEQDAVQAYNHFKNINAQAIEQANGQVANEAQEKMFLARQRVEQLRGIKNAMTNQRQAPQPLDPRLANHAKEWMGNNTWYDPSGKDEDSAITLTIDNRMAAEGWDPTLPEYWQELESRVKKYLPHRNTSYNKPQQRLRQSAPPVAGSGSSSSTGNSAGTFKLSSDRVQALKDAGIWDSPAERAEAVKRFREFDTAAAKGAR